MKINTMWVSMKKDFWVSISLVHLNMTLFLFDVFYRVFLSRCVVNAAKSFVDFV